MLAARRLERLEALANRTAGAGKPRPVVVECDVTRDGDLEHAVGEGLSSFEGLDTAIANAGFVVIGSLKNLSTEDYRASSRQTSLESCGLFMGAPPEIEKTKRNIVILESVAGWGAWTGDFASQNE